MDSDGTSFHRLKARRMSSDGDSRTPSPHGILEDPAAGAEAPSNSRSGPARA